MFLYRSKLLFNHLQLFLTILDNNTLDHFELDISNSAVVAEWLRRLTRNQFPSGSVGSSPTDCEKVLFAIDRFN